MKSRWFGMWFGTRRPSRTREEVIEGAARAAFVQAWASYMEENGTALRGELMDQAPRTPPAAVHWATKLINTMERMNKRSIDDMYAHAMHGRTVWQARQRGRGAHSFYSAPRGTFGHYTAMQALGHGVAWSDDNLPHGFLIPHAEFIMEGPNSFFGEVSSRSDIASRG